ncbi:MAG: hypothetical protein ACFFB3_01715 [Candidatus Hodarchaeota archaeon]
MDNVRYLISNLIPLGSLKGSCLLEVGGCRRYAGLVIMGETHGSNHAIEGIP